MILHGDFTYYLFQLYSTKLSILLCTFRICMLYKDKYKLWFNPEDDIFPSQSWTNSIVPLHPATVQTITSTVHSLCLFLAQNTVIAVLDGYSHLSQLPCLPHNYRGNLVRFLLVCNGCRRHLLYIMSGIASGLGIECWQCVSRFLAGCVDCIWSCILVRALLEKNVFLKVY